MEEGHKLGVVVPYRNRDEQLRRFLRKLPFYLTSKGIDFEIIIAEQMDEESFNRGALLNAGALQAMELGCDYLVFHDVDLIPRYVDYSYSNVPIELVGRVVDDSYEEAFKVSLKSKVVPHDFFGGAVLFPTDLFKKINGYSNKYSGWGFEDNDLLERCKEFGIPLQSQRYRQYSLFEPGFTFNGENSYISLNTGKIDPNKSVSFLVTFKVEELPFRETEISDECCVFSIPGLDLNFSYTNFGTYKFEVFDNFENSYSIHTKKLPLGSTNQVAIVFKDRKVTFYFNGVKVGSKECEVGHRFVTKSENLFIGTASPDRKEKAKWLKGQVSELAIFDKSLTQVEVANLFGTSYLGLGRYQPKFWLNARVVNEYTAPNLGTREGVEAYLQNCSIEPLIALESEFSQQVPWNRGGTFRCLPHKTNGSLEGSWQSWNTRLNQQRFQKVETLGTFKKSDGLNSLSSIARTRVEQRADNHYHVQVFFNKSLKKLK